MTGWELFAAFIVFMLFVQLLRVSTVVFIDYSALFGVARVRILTLLER